MRKKAFYMLVICTFCAFSCQSDTQKEEQSLPVSVDTPQSSSKGQLQPSAVTREAQLNGKNYTFTVTRSPDPSLPELEVSDHVPFLDNRIELQIVQGASEILHRSFTKKDFAQVVSPRFLERAMLEGLVYDRIENGKFLFAASVCIPTTDLYIPARILISPQGTVTIEKEDSMDDTLDAELQGSEE